MIKFNNYSPLIFSILICSYGMSTASIASTENFVYNAFLAIIITIYFFLRLARNQIFNKNILVLLFLSLIPLMITSRMNLASLFLMITLVLLKNKIFHSNERRTYLLISLCLLVLVFFANHFFDFNAAYSKEIFNPREEKFIYREALGFTHPNQAMLKALGISLIILLGCTRRNVVRYSVFTLIFIFILYYFTESRTVPFVILITSSFLVLFRKKLDEDVPIFLKKIVSLYPLMFLALTLISMNLSQNVFLNLLFSGRLGFYHTAFASYGLTLFGNPVIEKSSTIVVDSSYLNTLLSKGVLFFFCYALIYKCATNLTIMTYKKAILTTSFFMCAFTETMFFKFDLMFALLLILFYDKRCENYEKNFNLS